MLPLAALALAWSYRRHRRPLPLVVGVLAAVIGYLHILAGTPEWTVYGVLVLSVAAAILDWRASRAPALRPALGLVPRTEA